MGAAIFLKNPSNMALMKQRIILITLGGKCWNLEMEETLNMIDFYCIL